MLTTAEPAVAWLLREGDPALARLARRDVLRQDVDPDGALASPVVQALLTPPAWADPAKTAAQAYRKYSGAHWRLVSLVELGLPAGHAEGVALCDAVLDRWSVPGRLADVPVVEGRARRCASQEGNAVAVACRLGLAEDPRVRTLVEHLAGWQWPDGGWNCDVRPEASHSSFHETLPPLWGLAEYADATGDEGARATAGRAAELLLRHQVAFSTRTGRPIDPSFVVPHYPPYWHYDLLQALLVLTRAGFGADPRTQRARTLLADGRGPDGRWRAGRRWGRPAGSEASGADVVDWDGLADQMVTLNALRVGAGEPTVSRSR